MIVTTTNFIEQSVLDVRSNGAYRRRVTGRPAALLDTATLLTLHCLQIITL